MRYSLDLNGLCGLQSPTDDSRGRKTCKKTMTKQGSWTRNSSSPTNEVVQTRKGGKRKPKATKPCRKSSPSSQMDSSAAENPTAGRQTTNKTSPSIKRKTKRRKRTLLSSSNSPSSSSSAVCPSIIPCSLSTSSTVPMTSSPAGGQQVVAERPEKRGSSSLEQHFHHLHIVSLQHSESRFTQYNT